jgi:hypothetical protein
MHQKEPLCHPYDPFREHPGIYSKMFMPGKIYVSLRPFYIAHDLPLINNWLNFQFANLKKPARDPFQYTEDYYTTLLATANSQSLLGIVDHIPSFQADIYQAMLGPDSLLNDTSLNDKDYIIQIMMSPETMQNLSLSMYTLVATLDCLFNYPEVNRVIWMTNASEKNFRFIAGIAELDEVSCEDELQSYFIISKEKFKSIQFGLPLFPAEQPMALGC